MSRWIAATTTARGTYLRLQCTVTAPVQTPCNGQSQARSETSDAQVERRVGQREHRSISTTVGIGVQHQAVSVWVTLSSCEATPSYLQQRNVAIGRGFTRSGEDMENNQQPTSTTTQYL